MDSIIPHKKLLGLFILMIFTQWFIPTMMIFQKKNVSAKGQTYLFKLNAIDPFDPFRGKYIILNPLENSYLITKPQELDHQNIYASFISDSLGFAKIDTLTRKAPNHSDYLQVKSTNYQRSKGGYKLNIDYPFDRFYMNEHKAKAAENLIREILRKDDQNCYAVVKIHEGKSYLLDVKVDENSLADLIQ